MDAPLAIAIGDTLWFAPELCPPVRNPERRWFQFWKPRFVPQTMAQPYKVIDSYSLTSAWGGATTVNEVE